MKKLARITVTIIFMAVMIFTSISVEAMDTSTNAPSTTTDNQEITTNEVYCSISIDQNTESITGEAGVAPIENAESGAADEPDTEVVPVTGIYSESYYPDFTGVSINDFKLIGSVNFDEEFQKYVYNTAISYGLDPYIIFGLIERESTYRPDAVNKSHKGLMQINPKYQTARMAELGCTDLFDPYQNVLVGCSYLAELLANSDGNYELALMYYNQGNKAKARYEKRGASSYVKYIVRRSEEMKSEVTI